MVAAVLDIEALRQFRTMNLNSNWLKDLRTEVFRRMYEAPIHPKNLWLEHDPLTHEPVDDIYRDNIRRLQRRGAYTPPATAFPGAVYQGEATTEEAWREIEQSWAGWGEDED
jgi:hypothetical protein